MDEIAGIDPTWETTSHLMHECNQRGHTVFFLEPNDIYIRNSTVVARMHDVSVAPDMGMHSYWRALIGIVTEGKHIFESITDVDAMFLRKNPPQNYQTMEYLAPYDHVHLESQVIDFVERKTAEHKQAYSLRCLASGPLRRTLRRLDGLEAARTARGSKRIPDAEGKLLLPEKHSHKEEVMKKRTLIHLFIALFFIVAAGCAAMGGARHEYVMKGQVLEVAGGEAYVCIGSASGAKAGQELPVFRYVPSKILGEKQRPSYRRESVGTVKITKVVDEHFANATVVKGDVKVHDVAELKR